MLFYQKSRQLNFSRSVDLTIFTPEWKRIDCRCLQFESVFQSCQGSLVLFLKLWYFTSLHIMIGPSLVSIAVLLSLIDKVTGFMDSLIRLATLPGQDWRSKQLFQWRHEEPFSGAKPKFVLGRYFWPNKFSPWWWVFFASKWRWMTFSLSLPLSLLSPFSTVSS